jgi:1,4-dihydroxy-2-naphthoate octaprenyltransferase
MSSDHNNIFNLLIKEYEKLKDEQRTRIEFRDNLIFLTLGAIGAVFSFSVEHIEYRIALLVLPIICIIVGWTYLANDEKISSIGNYLRTSLFPRFIKIEPSNAQHLIENWEDYNHNDIHKRKRKPIQFFVDVSLFFLSPLASIIFFFTLSANFSTGVIFIAGVESLLIIFLMIRAIRDFNKRHAKLSVRISGKS